jgi:hypothetical protein
MPSTLIHLATDEVAALVELSGFKDRRGETIIKVLLPGCGSMDHASCQVMVPRIGTADSPRKWVGWYHCSCNCHEFTETKDGWSVRPAKAL